MDMVAHGFYRLKMKYWIWYGTICGLFWSISVEKLWNPDARIILCTCLRTGLFWFLFDRCWVHLFLLQSIHITHPILYTHLINFRSEVICTIRLIFFFDMYIFKQCHSNSVNESKQDGEHGLDVRTIWFLLLLFDILLFWDWSLENAYLNIL